MWRTVFVSVLCSMIIAAGVTAGTGWIIRGGSPALQYEEDNDGNTLNMVGVAADALTVGHAATTVITLQTDDTGDGTDLVLPAGSVGGSEITADSIDGTELADTIILDATLGITSGAAEGIAMTHAMTNDTAETAMSLAVTASDTSPATTAQYGLYIDNVASTEGMDAAIVIDNSDADDAVIAGILFIDAGGGFTTAINTANGAINAGTATVTSDLFAGVTASAFDATGAAAITVGSADVTTLAITNNGAMTVGAAATTDSLALESAGAITLEATGAINIGDASATSVIVLTAGGAAGGLHAAVPVTSLASGALTMNAINLATADAEYTVGATTCAASADIGTWFTVVLEDASASISIAPLDDDNIFTIPSLSLGAGDEVDSVSDAAHEGMSITFTCLAVNNWYMTGGDLINGTFDAIGWADGGAT